MHLTIHGMEMRFLNSSNVSLSLPLSLTSKVKFHNSRMISSELNTFGYHESFVCEILWILNHGSKYWSWRSHDTWIFYANIISRLRLWNFQLYPCANHDIYKKVSYAVTYSPNVNYYYYRKFQMLFKFFHRHFILSRKTLKIIKIKIQ